MDAAGGDVYRLTVAGQSQCVVATEVFAQGYEVFVGGRKYQTAAVDKALIADCCLLQQCGTEIRIVFAGFAYTFQRRSVENFCQNFGI